MARLLIGLGALGALALVGFFLLRLEPAAPSVERESLWIGQAERGALVVRVRGIGSLVPVEQRWLTAETSGQVERLVLLPGAEVTPSSVILVLSNPELEQELQRAELQLASAEAALANQRAQEEDGLLEMEFQLAQLEAARQNADVDVRVNEELFAEGLVAERDLLRSRVAAEQSARQFEILERRLASRREQMEQNLAPAMATVNQERSRLALLRRQVDDLNVRASIAGVLQRLPVDVGAQVTPGTQLAQVADPSSLKAEIRVPETQAKDLRIGQPVEIDNRNDAVVGVLTRIDPAVEGGQVTVDVGLNQLPRGARADQTVEGNVELETLADVVHVPRPAYARENGTVGVFVLASDGGAAVRRPVSFGRASVSAIAINDGLNPGERIILSDTSQYDDYDRLRLTQ